MVASSEDGVVEGRTSYRQALRSPISRQLWTASVVSTIGDYVALGALLFLAVDRTGRTLSGAAVLAVGVVPSLLTGVVAGRWLDRFRRERTLATLHVLGAASVCVPVLVGGAAAVFVTAALLAAVRIAVVAVRSGAIAEGVEDRRRGALVALLSSTDQGAQVLGFLTGGALYVLVGADTALLLDAVSFLVAAAILGRLVLPRPERRPEPAPITAGFTDIAGHPVLRLLGSLVVVTGLVASLPETLAPSVAGAGDPWRSVVLAAAPAGQVMAMTVLGRLPQIRRPAVQLVHLAGLALALVIASLGRSPAAVAAANVLVGAGTAWIVGPQVTFLRLAPKARMAQITGTMVAMLAVADGIGSLTFAALADAYSVSAAYAVAGALLVVTVVIGWVLERRSPAARALDRDELPASPLTS